MSMTPAEMREKAIAAAENEMVDGSVSDGDWAYNQGIKDAVNAIRAIPIPDTTAADEALATAREALRGAAETLRRVPRDSGVGDIAWKDAVECGIALAAIDAAKAKGGGL